MKSIKCTYEIVGTFEDGDWEVLVTSEDGKYIDRQLAMLKQFESHPSTIFNFPKMTFEIFRTIELDD
jgi:hypothetical protein